MTTSLVTVTPIVGVTHAEIGASIDGVAHVEIGATLGSETFVIRQVEQGPPGLADLHYVHDQMVASAAWVAVHNLGKFPSVTVIDSAGSPCEGTVSYDSSNQLTVTFSAAFAGTAYLN